MSELGNAVQTTTTGAWGFIKSPIESIIGADATPREKLLFAIGTSAILWYYLSVTCIGFNLIAKPRVSAAAPVGGTVPTAGKEDDTVPTTGIDLCQFMSFSITTISGTLATYLGMVLGIRPAVEGYY